MPLLSSLQYQRSRQFGGGAGGIDSRRGGAEAENAAFIDEQKSRQHVSSCPNSVACFSWAEKGDGMDHIDVHFNLHR